MKDSSAEGELGRNAEPKVGKVQVSRRGMAKTWQLRADDPNDPGNTRSMRGQDMLPWEGFRLECPVISQDPWKGRNSQETRGGVEYPGGLRQRMLKMLRDSQEEMAVDQGEEEEAG